MHYDTPAQSEADLSSKDGQGQTIVDLTPYIETNDSAPKVMTFAIEKHQRNTDDNPDRENTNTMPWLVRRVDSEEILPHPFKTTNQLICTSYLSLLCCCCFSVWAVKYAWETKEKRNKGIYTSAIKEGKATCCCIILSVIFGTILWIIGVALTLALYLTDGS